MSKPQLYKKTISLGDGREISIESGVLAKQADGAVVVRMGNAMLLATVVSSKEPKEGIDFLPLTVDYQEKYAAAGRFPGGFLKREGRLSEYEILTSRIVDRAIRPLFPDDYHCETQVMVTLISADTEVIPDCLVGLGASAALSISDIPFQGPISEVRVAKIDGKLKINPSAEEVKEGTLELIVSGSKNDINMVEGEMAEVGEAEMLEALKFAHEAIKLQCQAQEDLAQEMGRTEKREHIGDPQDLELYQKLEELWSDRILEIARNFNDKTNRADNFKAIRTEYLESLPEDHELDEEMIKRYFSKIKKQVIRNMVLKEGKRLDGRKLNEVRSIWCEVDFLPSAHGSAVFTRGETQSLTSITLGSKMDSQLIDDVMFKGYNRFLLHYNFPAFSTGEARPNRGPGRREIGHGNLAMRAIKMVMPDSESNPYVVRIVSDILESNGSSSMATVCAASLALLDAGIKIRKPVSGIAMGLISGEKGDYAVLSDILGDEDHIGDMDFKITGTEDGITACQMDIKVEGLSYEVLEKALMQAREGRLHILDKMNEVISQPREEYKPHVPRIETLIIDKDYIGAVIGPGGKIIQKIQEDSGAHITIEEKDEKGYVEISSPDKESIEKAKKWIRGIVTVPEVGETYSGTVKSIMPFGAFIEYLPGKEGLLHISEIAWEKTETMEGVMEEGEKLEVKLIGIDERSGKVKLSKKALTPKPEGWVDRPPRSDRDRGDRGGDRGGRRDDRGRDHNRSGRDDRGPRNDSGSHRRRDDD
ncbi:MAG: polyribonucleotide nucleotidyltransferase [Bacteroidia bacterium]